MEEMTPRERVLRAIEHKEPDRVPILFGVLSSILSITDSPPYGYEALCKFLSISDYPKSSVNVLCDVNNVDGRVLDRLHVDFDQVIPNSWMPEYFNGGEYCRLKGFNGMVFKRTSQGCRDSCGYVYTLAGDMHCPLHNATTIMDIENYQYWTDYSDPIFYEGKAKEAKKKHEETDYAIIAGDLPVTFGEMYQYLLGFDRKLIDIKKRPEFFHAVMEKIWDGAEVFLENWLNEVGDYIDLIIIFDDQGMQTGPIYSPEDFRKFIKPYWERYVKFVRKLTKAKLVMHSCGSNYTVYPEMIDLGFVAHHTLQPFAWNMEPWRLKKEFGDKICFIGGFDHQKVMPRHTPDEVKEFVKGLISDYAPGGGYIFAPTHDIGGEVPPENIVAGFDAAFAYGKYPIEIKERPEFYKKAFKNYGHGILP